MAISCTCIRQKTMNTPSSSSNPGYAYDSAGLTHPGNARTVNQDALLERPDLGIWLVADGVGGHSHGEWASRAVVDAVNGLRPEDLHLGQVEAVRQRLAAANARLVELGQRESQASIIGSTVAALTLHASTCTCLWAGDSRVYGFRGGQLARLTQDHSEVEMMVERGLLSAAEALHHPKANVIHRAIGRSEVLDLDERSYDLSPHDRFLLCSDGLSKELAEEEIALLLQGGDCRACCQRLMDAVLSRQCLDNVAIVVVDVERQHQTTDTVQMRSPFGRNPS